MEQQLVEQALAVLAAAQDAAGHSSRSVAAQLQDQARRRPSVLSTPLSSLPATEPLTRCTPDAWTQLKAGDPRTSASVAVSLSASGRPLEARVFGLTVLAHLVKARWQHFAPDDRASLARLALDRLREGAAL
jgi:hypothetical protein